jgi:hypothetical protein
MPPPRYETPCRPVPEPTERDRLPAAVVWLTPLVVAAAGLLAGCYLLWGGTTHEAGRPAPATTVTTSPTTPTTTSASSAVVMPPKPSTVTSEVAPAPPPVTTEPPAATPTPRPTPAEPAPEPPREEDPRFAVVGQPCPRPGAYSLTSRYEPVVCRRGSWRPARRN